MPELTFEAAVARLEQIVQTLEGGRCSLDESMKLFEEGTKLTAFCSKALKTAEQKIVQLTAEPAPETKPAKAAEPPAQTAFSGVSDGDIELV